MHRDLNVTISIAVLLLSMLFIPVSAGADLDRPPVSRGGEREANGAGGPIGCGKEVSDRFSGSSTAKFPGYNILVLVLDTLRADHLGCYGYFRPTSPVIDKLSSRAVIFRNAFASIPITLPSHTSILTGLYPQTTGIIYNHDRVDARVTTLAEVLQKAGYRTGAVVSTAVLKASSKLSQGFECYSHNFGEAARREQKGWKVKGIAKDANRLAFEWLDRIKKDEKFFLFINYFDVHSPYIKQGGFQDLFNHDSQKFLQYLEREWTTMPKLARKRKAITNYDRSIAYTDHYIGRFLKGLQDRGLLDKTIVILTSDHGQGLYQHHDYWSHGPYLYDEQINIPLLILFPGATTRQEIDRLVETVDLFPTVLDLVGVPLPNRVDGASLVPLMEQGDREKPDIAYAMRNQHDPKGRILPRQLCVRTSTEKLISTQGEENQFYDFEEDPYEKTDIYDTAEKQRGKLISRLILERERWFKLEKTENIAHEAPDQETLKVLKSLGYLQ